MTAPVRLEVRGARAADDASVCADIYRPFVLDTAVTFETSPPDSGEMAARIARAQQAHAWLVLSDGGRVVGYAYGGSHRSRPAYRYACEVSIYLESSARGRGGGRTLYSALLHRLTERGFHTAFGGIALPNPASLRLHTALGFEPVGTFRQVGWKLERWHDVTWMQRALSAGPPADGEREPARSAQSTSSSRPRRPNSAAKLMP